VIDQYTRLLVYYPKFKYSQLNPNQGKFYYIIYEDRNIALKEYPCLNQGCGVGTQTVQLLSF
jgi:hypothetical protein